MKKLLAVVFLISGFFVHAQDVEVLQQLDSIPARRVNTFTLLESGADSDTLNPIGIIQVSGTVRDGIEAVYRMAIEKAESMSANSYRVVEFSNREDGIRIVMNLYFADKTVLNNNVKHQPKNTVYVFGSDKPDKTVSCRVNNKKIELPPFTYYKQENKRGQDIKVSKGGITGMAVWVSWAEGKSARYISLSGFGLSGVGVSPTGGAGVGFNTGRISYIDEDFGRFLVAVLKPVGDSEN